MLPSQRHVWRHIHRYLGTKCFERVFGEVKIFPVAQEREFFSLLRARKRIFLYVARKNENSPLIYWGDPKIVSCNSDRLIFDFGLILGIPHPPCARKRIFLFVARKKENFSLCCVQEREFFSMLRARKRTFLFVAQEREFSLSCATCESIPRLKRI